MVWCDNLSVVLPSANPIQHAWTKHLELDIYFVREKVLHDHFIVKHIPTIDQIADILTKAISSAQFQTLRDKLRVHLCHLEFEGGCFGQDIVSWLTRSLLLFLHSVVVTNLVR